ncbi:acyl-CoA dehydrogenase, partial [Pseudomonas aeruginosa]
PTRPQPRFPTPTGPADTHARSRLRVCQARAGTATRVEPGAGFARRWREAAFVPIVTPSLVQLRAELQRQAEAKA